MRARPARRHRRRYRNRERLTVRGNCLRIDHHSPGNPGSTHTCYRDACAFPNRRAELISHLGRKQDRCSVAQDEAVRFAVRAGVESLDGAPARIRGLSEGRGLVRPGHWPVCRRRRRRSVRIRWGCRHLGRRGTSRRRRRWLLGADFLHACDAHRKSYDEHAKRN